jgi:hypothetical protein
LPCTLKEKNNKRNTKKEYLKKRREGKEQQGEKKKPIKPKQRPNTVGFTFPKQKPKNNVEKIGFNKKQLKTDRKKLK